MNPTEFTPFLSTLGGILLGLSAVGMMWLLGRITGISGIVKTSMFQSDGRNWRLMFLLGIILGGGLLYRTPLFYFEFRENFPTGLLLMSGLLVGIGTSLGSGCTSGHGICGMARLSSRSFLATALYLCVGIVSAVITMTFLGVSS